MNDTASTATTGPRMPTRAYKAVEPITEHIPLGQPILIGHHSERRARKNAQKIEDGMHRAVKMWDTSKYWTDRAAGAVRYAKYKEQPSVRSRRIKGIEADKRKRSKDGVKRTGRVKRCVFRTLSAHGFASH